MSLEIAIDFVRATGLLINSGLAGSRVSGTAVNRFTVGTGSGLDHSGRFSPRALSYLRLELRVLATPKEIDPIGVPPILAKHSDKTARLNYRPHDPVLPGTSRIRPRTMVWKARSLSYPKEKETKHETLDRSRNLYAGDRRDPVGEQPTPGRSPKLTFLPSNMVFRQSRS